MAPDRADALRSLLDRSYAVADYPVLDWQSDQWRHTRPLAGVSILDATPAFTNTLAKYVPLVAAGAELTVSLSPLLPHDPAVVEVLADVGIPVLHSPDERTFDVVMDCAGVLATTRSRTGYTELTKSGQHVYEDCRQPVFLVDDSKVKVIETSLGTGDGLERGLAHFGHNLSGRRVVIVGCGKVGKGAAVRARDAGAQVTLIDQDRTAVAPPGCDLIDAADTAAVRSATDHAWCLVTATGHEAALAAMVDDLVASDLVLANLGAEDEFGPTMPAARVLNDKAPINFALTEPTHLRYLDATMALVNACALCLLDGGHPAGINHVPRTLEDEILAIVRQRSTIAAELSAIAEEPV